MSRYRLGIDIGGTFTDVVLSAADGTPLYVGKHPSDPDALAMVDGVDLALKYGGIADGDVDVLVHATTLGTNALIQQDGARVALVTTAGFRDVLELGRGRRPALYDLQFDRVVPLAPRDRRFEVRERIAADGSVVEPLDPRSVQEVIASLRAVAPESIAVSLLHTYANPDHETQVRTALQAAFPAIPVVCSSQVLPEVGEYERTSTTVICAYLAPLFDRYLDRVADALRDRGIPAELLLMHSGGGLMRRDDVRMRAHALVESGPAAGALAATRLLAYRDPAATRDYIAFDMGGTTAKACLIKDGRPAVTTDYEVGRGSHESFSVRGSGLPIKSPVVDLVESGHGGGSIAWVDEAGVLKVGPHSAGSHPGPACYGRGGALPTVTDCNLILGRLDPARFADGTLPLRLDLATAAVSEHLCARLQVSVDDAAAAVLRVVNASMAGTIRVAAVQRGVDPRAVTLVAFGGGGPLHAAELGASRILVPPEPGVFSAVGLVRADLRMDFSRTCLLPAERTGEIAAILAELVADCRSWLDGVGSGTIRPQVDARYRGQSHAITVDLVDTAGALEEVADLFEQAHQRQYGFSTAGAPVEVVMCRASGSAPLGREAPGQVPVVAPAGTVAPPSTQRPVYFPATGTVPTRIYQRGDLGRDTVLTGPALVEERTSSVLVPPGAVLTVAADGVLEIELP